MKNKTLLIIKCPVFTITNKEGKPKPWIVSESKAGNRWTFYNDVITRFPFVVGCDGASQTNG